MNRPPFGDDEIDAFRAHFTFPFTGGIRWDTNGRALAVAADRTLESALRRMVLDDAVWIVVVRRVGPDTTYRYAFRRQELEYLAQQSPEKLQWSLEDAMDMHEWMSSSTSRRRRPFGPSVSQQGPASGRIIDLGIGDEITAIGEIEDMMPERAARSAPPDEPAMTGSAPDAPPAADVPDPGAVRVDTDVLDLGPMRGRSRGGGSGGEPPAMTRAPAPGTAPPVKKLDITMSAAARAEMDLGAMDLIDFRIELTSEAKPLAASTTGTAAPDKPIVVSLSVENDALEVLRSAEQSVDPPGPGEPRTGMFAVKAVRAGVTRVAVSFRQGGSDLGVIGLAVEVVDAGARTDRSKSSVNAAPRDPADDDKLALIIQQRVEQRNGVVEISFEYIVHSEALGLPYIKLNSKPLLDKNDGKAATVLDFVERIYERVTQELKSHDDLKQLQREARALGAALCRELLDPAVAKVLWPLRDRIRLIQVVSWEPYIPWELVRLCDPDTGDIDDRYLAEYGLVRTLADEPPSLALPMKEWAYMGATFPMGMLQRVGSELDYFTNTTPGSLRARGIQPSSVAATRDAFYDALAEGGFDVLHLSCHAESPHQQIDRATLIIGDETAPGDSQPRLVEVDTITVQAEARLKARRPVVFLNACETGRIGAVLTAWGGWPNVFLRAGAGAFVGSSWAVRDKPAAAFATAFYNALLDGGTLAEAASAARAEAKKLGDVSWLAYKVYGHPRARRVTA